jgi:hypothetical protein
LGGDVNPFREKFDALTRDKGWHNADIVDGLLEYFKTGLVLDGDDFLAFLREHVPAFTGTRRYAMYDYNDDSFVGGAMTIEEASNNADELNNVMVVHIPALDKEEGEEADDTAEEDICEVCGCPVDKCECADDEET